jgi:hypothetical protein
MWRCAGLCLVVFWAWAGLWAVCPVSGSCAYRGISWMTEEVLP